MNRLGVIILECEMWNVKEGSKGEKRRRLMCEFPFRSGTCSYECTYVFNLDPFASIGVWFHRIRLIESKWTGSFFRNTRHVWKFINNGFFVNFGDSGYKTYKHINVYLEDVCIYVCVCMDGIKLQSRIVCAAI